ncbi:BTAD domain-containing putative transcriptional regulator [Streptomyces sp. NPDC056909]|uniref:AfsR/SARP family transcriptional regulator n=1 Tax=Streptomyces sp. NPDC056909 TaxID=3345963 RepID=UPI0036B78817
MFGEMEVRSAGQSLDVGTPRQQTVLAALIVDARRPVAIETLVNRVWDHTPPANPRAVLYSHLSRIRRLLAQAATLDDGTTARIERRHAGYVLDADPDLTDLHRFRRLAEQGGDRQRGDDVRAAALAEALGLWRGSPLAGLPGEWAAQVRDSWHQRRLDAVVQWAQIELRLGHPALVIATLPDLAAEYPLVEPFETLLMRALHATGRGAEALDRYSAVRQRLADKLGTDPGPELRALHQAVLHGKLPPAPRDPVTTARTVTPPAPRPRPTASASVVAPHWPDLAPPDGDESPTAPSENGPLNGPLAPDHSAALKPVEPGSAEESQLPKTSSGRVDAVGTDTPTTDPLATGTPPIRVRLQLTPRRTMLAALTAVVLPAAIGSVRVFQRDEGNELSSVTPSAPVSIPPSVERAQALFATAQKLDQGGRAEEAQAAIVDAVRLYDELIKLNPDRNAPPLAPAVIRALGRAGVDFSVSEAVLRTWLVNPVYTPYPAISQMLLLRGWKLKAPVYLDVIVSNYERAPGITSPRNVADVKVDVLKAATLEGSNTRYGTQVRDLEQLLEP